MFDCIKDELYCPYCGKLQQKDSFQTKSFLNVMTSIELKDVDESFNFYHQCCDCGSWIELIWNPVCNKNAHADSSSEQGE